MPLSNRVFEKRIYLTAPMVPRHIRRPSLTEGWGGLEDHACGHGGPSLDKGQIINIDSPKWSLYTFYEGGEP